MAPADFICLLSSVLKKEGPAYIQRFKNRIRP